MSLSPIEELAEAVSGKYRAVLIAERDVDLRPSADANRLFMLKIAEGSLASGGRGGGFGERRVVMVAEFVCSRGEWTRVFVSEDEPTVAKFEVPYHVSRIPLMLRDGTEGMGYGVIDPPLVEEFAKKSE